ncbi:MAG: dienelactone hydrolase family protein [Actinomycetota bacterium]
MNAANTSAASALDNAATQAGWAHDLFSAAGFTRDVYRKGTGPAVVVVHEIPGITPAVMRFAEEVVAAGFTVAMPLLVGEVGREPDGKYMAASMSKVCVSREFTTMAMRKTSPIISWLRALAKQLHREVGGTGVGAGGMCFSGGFALGMMLDDVMVAPVLSQPSLPFAFGKARAADLNLSPDEQLAVQRRAVEGCQVLGLRYTGDRLVGNRFDSLRKLLGEQFIAVEFASTAKSDHSVLTEQRQEDGVRRVVDFLREKLQP